MILLWGPANDGPLAAVRAVLDRRGLEHRLIDQHRVERIAGVGGFGDLETDLQRVTAAYLRPDDWRRIPSVAQAGLASDLARRACETQEALVSWSEVATARVVNRPSAMASNFSKPYQLSLIRAAGFATPATLVTTDPGAVLDFEKHHGALIYKSVSGVRSVVSRLGAEHLDRLTDVAACPTQFQAYVDGDDYRVHVVGSRLFATRIRCAATDYRYASRSGARVEIIACALPEEIAARCRGLAATLGLALTGIDLRLDRTGRWVCFEANPSPAFTFYEAHAAQPIAAAVADLLAGLDPIDPA